MQCKFNEHEFVTKFLKKTKDGEEGERECAKCKVREVFETRRVETVAVQ